MPELDYLLCDIDRWEREELLSECIVECFEDCISRFKKGYKRDFDGLLSFIVEECGDSLEDGFKEMILEKYEERMGLNIDHSVDTYKERQIKELMQNNKGEK